MGRGVRAGAVLLAGALGLAGCRPADRAGAAWRRFALPWLTDGRVVAWNLRTPSAVLVRGEHAYVTEIGKRRAVLRSPKAGGRAEVLAQCAGHAFWLAGDADRVVWTEVEAGLVRAYDRRDGAVRTLAAGRREPNMIVATGGRAYWVEYAGGVIASAPLSGGPVRVEVPGLEEPDRLATDGTWLYWTELRFGPEGPLKAARLGAGRPRVLGTVVNQVDLAAADGEVFCLEGRARALKRFSVDGRPPALLARDVGSVGNVAVHGRHVYWSEEFADAILRVPRAGGPVERLSGAVHPEVLSFDGGWLYWTEPTTHTVRRIPLPADASRG
jgi:hypothetical protein